MPQQTEDTSDTEQTAEEVRRRRREIGIESDDENPTPPPVVIRPTVVVHKTSTSASKPNTIAWTQPRKIRLFSGHTVNRWRKGALIGKGATGTVYEAVDLDTDAMFAVKEVVFPEDFADNPEDRKRFEALRAEVGLLQELQHENIVRFIGIDKIDFSMYIQMEFVTGGSVQQIIKQFGPLADDMAARYTRQLVAGLKFLHSKNIIHRDIKGANILVNDAQVVKLADFGSAKQMLDPEQLQNTLAGTPYFMSPEVVRQEGHSKPADVWSLGATVLQMVTGLAPYQNLAPVPALFKIGHGTDVPIPEDSKISPLCKDFLLKCLCRDQSQRATVGELEFHPWIVVSNGSFPANTSSASKNRFEPVDADIGTSTSINISQTLPESPDRSIANSLELLSPNGVQTNSVEERIRDFLITMSFTHGIDGDKSLPRSSDGGDSGAPAVNPRAETDDDDDDGAFNEEHFNQFVQGLSGGKM